MNKLEISNLSKNYKDKQVLQDFSFTLSGGEIVGLIGVNGAGKTTLLNIIAGHILPSSGTMRFNDDVFSYNADIKRDFGILIEPGFYDYMDAYSNLKSVLYLNGDLTNSHQKIKEMLALVGLKKEAKNHVKSFSFGMKQRLGFAQALLNAKKLMILDEPFVGLDINGRNTVKNYIKQYVKAHNIGVIFSDHNLDEVNDLCDRVIVIKRGKKVYDGKVISEQRVYVKVDNLDNMRLLSPSDFDVLDHDWIAFNTTNLSHKMRTIIAHFNIVDIKRDDNPLERILRDEKHNSDTTN